MVYNENISATTFSEKEKEWIEKKKALIERFSAGKRDQKVDIEEIAREKERLLSEIQNLEESNSIKAAHIKDLQHQVSENKKKSQKEFKRSDDLRKKLIVLQTSEKSLINELSFLESEREKLYTIYKKVSEGLEANIKALDNSVNDIGFIKGETYSLIEKMSMLENNIPKKSSDLENIDEIFSGTVKSLRDLYGRMQRIEKKVKISYYKNRKN